MNSRRVLITGSSRGIGRAIALRLARDGFTVTVHCRSARAEADAVAAEIVASGGAASVLQFDVCDRATTRAVLAADVAAAGAYYAIVCNAGLARDNAFPARVEELIYLGDHIRTRVNVCGNDKFIVKIPNAQSHARLTVGDTITVCWAKDDCRALDA